MNDGISQTSLKEEIEKADKPNAEETVVDLDIKINEALQLGHKGGWVETTEEVFKAVCPSWQTSDSMFIRNIRVTVYGRIPEIEAREKMSVDELLFGNSKVDNPGVGMSPDAVMHAPDGTPIGRG